VTNETRIMFVGDVVGSPGRRALLDLLPQLRERYDPQFLVVNGENAAGGIGITPKVARGFFSAGVDVITLGNHTYRHREVYDYLEEEDRILRPANFLRGQPGHGWCVVSRGDVRLGVISISGNLFMKSWRPALMEADNALAALEGQVDHVLVDIHAEATSEKVALGWYLDGRVTAVVGTHTHVPPADARVLPGGTAYVSDVGMTGARGGVIGVKRELAIESLLTQMPVRFETADQDPWVNAVLIRASEPMRASSIEQVLEPAGLGGRAGGRPRRGSPTPPPPARDLRRPPAGPRPAHAP
jgi:metallophosphoesterase (TIGR00282 family)